MAEMPTVDSVMHPIITFMPSLRAVPIMRRAGIMSPALAQLDVDPMKRPVAAFHVLLGLATLVGDQGQERVEKTRRIPAKSSTASGCSMNSTPRPSTSGR